MTGIHNDERDLRFAYFTVEQASEAILWHGEDGRFVWANEAACRHFGYSREELLTLATYDINPDFRKDKWRKLWDKLSKVKKFVKETRHRKKDGNIIPVEVSTNLIEFEGEQYTCSFVRDISKRKQAEEEKAQAFEEIQRLRKQLELENEYLNEEVLKLQTYGDIVGNSPALQNIMKQIEMVAPTDAGVIIFGESGTGKELVAREIHRQSARSHHPMIKVNCASIPRELYESEFFGHVKGAFTGAVKDRIGRFELANGGTLFLDEVGEIPLELQSKLLRVLQEGTHERVGSEKTQKVDVRIIAATNRDLKLDVEKGRFREDLYYRLNIFPVEVLPLRKRKGDIPALALHFMKLAAKKFNCPLRQLSRANILQLENYDWPGNVRELQNVIERTIISSRSSTLRFNLPTGEGLNSSPATAAKAESSEGREVLTEEEVKRLERENIAAALERTHWKIFGAGGAAELLDMRPTTLASRIKKMGLKKPE